MCDTCCPKEQKLKQNPVTRESLEITNRRGFMSMLLAASGAFAMASLPLAARAFVAEPLEAAEPEGKGLQAGLRKEIAGVADVPEGKALNFSYPDADHPAILVHLPSGEFRAYHVECTHLGCPVYWDAAETRLKCP